MKLLNITRWLPPGIVVALATAAAVSVYGAELPAACSDSALHADAKAHDTCKALAENEGILLAKIRELAKAQAHFETSTAIATAHRLLDAAADALYLDQEMAPQLFARAKATIDMAERSAKQAGEASANTH